MKYKIFNYIPLMVVQNLKWYHEGNGNVFWFVLQTSLVFEGTVGQH